MHQVSPHWSATNAFHVAILKLTIEDPNIQQFWSLEEAGTSQHTKQKKGYTNTRHPVSVKVKMAHTQPDFHGNQTIPIFLHILLCVKDVHEV